jgi:hypothetical protein
MIYDRFWSKVSKTDGCWTWTPTAGRGGYGRFWLNRRNVAAHHVAFWLEHDYWPSPICLHICDNPSCVRPDHLREGTTADNVADRCAKGRSAIGHRNGGHMFPPRGEKNGRAKLTTDQVSAIRAMPGRYADIASLYGVCRSTVSHIKNRRNWRVAP